MEVQDQKVAQPVLQREKRAVVDARALIGIEQRLDRIVARHSAKASRCERLLPLKAEKGSVQAQLFQVQVGPHLRH